MPRTSHLALRSSSPLPDPGSLALDRLEDRVSRILQRLAAIERVHARTGLVDGDALDEILGGAAGMEREVAGLLGALDLATVTAAWSEVDRLRARIAYAARRVQRLVILIEDEAGVAG